MTTQKSVSLAVALAGALCAMGYLWMAFQSRSYGAADFTDAAYVYGACSLITLLLAVWLSQTAAGRTASYSQPVTLVLCFAVLFRMLGVASFPVLEDDFYRYLWDGWVFINQGSPYGVAPAEFFANEAVDSRFSQALDGVNYPEIPTVYGPTLQLVFGAAYLIDPGQVWPLQVVFGVADMVIVFLLLQMIDRNSPTQLLCWFLYAWSPLLIKEFATTAHPDILGAMLIVLALWLRRSHHWLTLGVLLGLAVGVKPFALVIAPFLIGFERRAIAGFVVAIVGLTLPFLSSFWGISEQAFESLMAGVLAVWVPEGLRAMGQGWLFNAGLYEMFAALGWVDQPFLQRLFLGAFALVWVLMLWRSIRARAPEQVAPEHVIIEPVVWLVGLFLLVLPALNPWYVAWLLPFAVLCPYATPWVASYALFLSYVTGINVAAGVDELYTVPGWVLGIEFAAIGAAILYDFGWRRRLAAGIQV